MAEVTGITKPQRLKSSAVSQAQKKPSKLCCNFLLKAIIITIFLVIIPLFPSQAPEFLNPSIFTRSWELLHLIFVGIAVSYGLFSRRNDDDVSDNSAVEETCTNNSKFDSTQSFVSTLLEVSSVFDDDTPSSTGSSDDSSSKIQTWSSQYYRNEPVVVVSKEKTVVRNEDRTKNSTSSSVVERPLLLPVRSLKPRVSDQTCNESVNEDLNSGDPRSFGPSNLSLSSKGTWNRKEVIRSRSLRSRVGGGTGNDFIYRGGDGGLSRSLNRSGSSLNSSQESLNGSENLRTRSLRSNVAGETSNNNDLMYVNGNGGVRRSFTRPNASSRGKADLSNENSNKTINDGFFWGLDDDGGGHGDDSSKCVEEEETVVLPSPIPWRSRSGRMEMNEETESPTKRIDRSSNTIDNSIANSTNTSPDKQHTSSGSSSPRKASPSRVSSLESQAKTMEAKPMEEDIRRRRTKYKVSVPVQAQPPPPPPPPPPVRRSSLVKSRSSMTNAEDPPEKELWRSVWSEPKEPTQLSETEEDELLHRANNVGMEPIRSTGIDGSLMGKSVRTISSGETIAEARRREMEAKRSEKRSRDCDPRGAIGGPPEENAEAARNSYPLELTEYPKETRDFLEHVFAGTDDDDESETEEENQVSKGLGNDHSTVDEGAASGVADEAPPDVDKKADEFIAKFREQIRLQRIDSIRRSSGHASRNSRR